MPMPVIQQVFIDIRGIEDVEKHLFSEKTIRVLFDSVRIILRAYHAKQLYIKVGYDQTKLKNYIQIYRMIYINQS
ncbi:hypothetical protein ACVXZ0_00715 [Staphylococcus aureus]